VNGLRGWNELLPKPARVREGPQRKRGHARRPREDTNATRQCTESAGEFPAKHFSGFGHGVPPTSRDGHATVTPPTPCDGHATVMRRSRDGHATVTRRSCDGHLRSGEGCVCSCIYAAPGAAGAVCRAACVQLGTRGAHPRALRACRCAGPCRGPHTHIHTHACTHIHRHIDVLCVGVGWWVSKSRVRNDVKLNPNLLF